MRLFRNTNTQDNTNNLNEEIAREVYVKSLQELVKKLEEKDCDIEYYKNKYKNQVAATKRLRNKIRELESKKRSVK